MKLNKSINKYLSRKIVKRVRDAIERENDFVLAKIRAKIGQDGLVSIARYLDGYVGDGGENG